MMLMEITDAHRDVRAAEKALARARQEFAQGEATWETVRERRRELSQLVKTREEVLDRTSTAVTV